MAKIGKHWNIFFVFQKSIFEVQLPFTRFGQEAETTWKEQTQNYHTVEKQWQIYVQVYGIPTGEIFFYFQP